jgi:hypothetical protein
MAHEMKQHGMKATKASGKAKLKTPMKSARKAVRK